MDRMADGGLLIFGIIGVSIFYLFLYSGIMLLMTWDEMRKRRRK